MSQIKSEWVGVQIEAQELTNIAIRVGKTNLILGRELRELADRLYVKAANQIQKIENES